MNARIKTAGAVAARSLPLIVGVVLSTTHPAMATLGSASSALAGIATGATVVQGAMQFAGGIMCIIGIAMGALHFVQRREDWLGAGERVFAGVVCGVVISNAPTIATLGGGATF